MDEKRIVVSLDSHVPVRFDLKPYLDSRWHETFDYSVKAANDRLDAGRRHRPSMEDAPRASGRSGSAEELKKLRPLEQRLKDLDADGVAGEFVTLGFGAVSTDPEFMHAMTQAEIRYFVDQFAPAADRFRGAVVVTLPAGMDVVVQEIDEAHKNGVTGIMLAGDPKHVALHLPGYNSHYYDPMWAAVSERNMVVVWHTGWSRERPLVRFSGSDYDPGWESLNSMKMQQDVQAILPQMLLGAVPQRYPGLKFGIVESQADWIPAVLAKLDNTVKGIGESSIKYEMLPSEMWQRQGFASGPLSAEDIAARHEVGLANIAWGSDYPHSEGTWPISRRWLGYLFRDVPPEETDLMVGGNAARLFGFDLEKLAQTPAASVPWMTPEEASRWHVEDDSAVPFFRQLVDS